MSLFTLAVLLVGLLFLFFLLGLEIGFAMGLAGFIGFALVRGIDVAMSLVAKGIYSVFSSYGFTVIPMFVFNGSGGVKWGSGPQALRCYVQVHGTHPWRSRYRHNCGGHSF